MTSSGPGLTLSQNEAKELSGWRWNLHGTTYYFAERDPKQPGMPPWMSGTEAMAYPLLDAKGNTRAFVKFWERARVSPKRIQRTQWLIEQRLQDWTAELRGAPRAWVETRRAGRPEGIGFDFSCPLADAVPGLTWLELKGEIACGAVDFDDELRRRCAENLLRALVHLERHGLVHGDLSPNNVIVDFDASAEEPVLYVIDLDAFHAARAGPWAKLSSKEGGTYGTQGYYPAEVEDCLENGGHAVPFSDGHARDMLLLELACFDETCDFESPASQWNENDLQAKLQSSRLAKELSYLRRADLRQLPEKRRPTSYELARQLSMPIPPRIKGRSLHGPFPSQPAPPRTTPVAEASESWLKQAVVVLWELCAALWGLTSLRLSGWLVGESAPVGLVTNLIHEFFRSVLTVSTFLGGMALLCVLVMADRQPQWVRIAGLGFRIPALGWMPANETRRRIVVSAQLSVILIVLAVMFFW